MLDSEFKMPCVILCGGKSSRMGEDKSLLPFGGFSTLAEFQYERLKPYFSEVLISCKDASIYGFEAEFVEDEQESYMPYNGILSSFNWTGLPYHFFIPVDTPFLSIETIRKIFSKLDCSVDGVVARDAERRHNLVSIFSSSVIPQIEKLIREENFKMGALIDGGNFNMSDVLDAAEFYNVNTKEEYAMALQKNR